MELASYHRSGAYNFEVAPRLSERLAMGWTGREGNMFRNCPDRPWGPSSLLYNGYRVSFPVVKGPGRGADHPPLSRAEVKERLELYT